MAGKLDDFCQMISFKYGSLAGIAPGDLAKDFVAYSGLSSYPSFIEIHQILKQYGIDQITRADLKAGKLKGHHFSYRGQGYQVQYEQDLWMGTVEFVMLHELYEIICERCEKWCNHYKPPHIPQICVLANRFAASTLMQPEVLLDTLFASGFDIVQLHHRFYKAYSSVAIRTTEVINDSEKEKPLEAKLGLLVIIYERMEAGDPWEWGFCIPEKFRVRYSLRTNGIRLGTKGGRWTQSGHPRRPNYRAPSYPKHLIPQKGDGVKPNSLAMDVVDTGECCCLERATGFDFWGQNDLHIIAQPVTWFGRLAKVVLVGIRYKDRHLIKIQLNGLHKPLIIKESYQVI